MFVYDSFASWKCTMPHKKILKACSTWKIQWFPQRQSASVAQPWGRLRQSQGRRGNPKVLKKFTDPDEIVTYTHVYLIYMWYIWLISDIEEYPQVLIWLYGVEEGLKLSCLIAQKLLSWSTKRHWFRLIEMLIGSLMLGKCCAFEILLSFLWVEKGWSHWASAW